MFVVAASRWPTASTGSFATKRCGIDKCPFMSICPGTLTHDTVFIYRLLLNIHNVCGCINIYSVFDPFKSGNVFVLYGVHILVVKVMLCISPS